MAIGKKEQIVGIIPGDLIHFYLKLFFSFDFVSLHIHKGDEVFFVSHGDGLAIWTPTNVDVFTYNKRQQIYINNLLGKKSCVKSNFTNNRWGKMFHSRNRYKIKTKSLDDFKFDSDLNGPYSWKLNNFS